MKLENNSDASANPPSAKIIYIVGDGRCGSTILDRFLGAAAGGVSLNELNELLRFGYAESRRCACGETFPSCDFWSGITEKLDLSSEKVSRLSIAQKKYESTKRFLRTSRQLQKPKLPADLAEYIDYLTKLVNAITETQEAKVLVDSSKLPARALLLSHCPGVHVHVVHVVRHPCAVVNAWRKTKFDPGRGDKMEKHGLMRTVAFWWARNKIGALLKRRLPYLVVRYEDFVADPLQVAAATMELIEEPLQPIDHSDDGYSLPSLHTISGNPDRFRSGKTKLTLDDKWKAELSVGRRRLVCLLTAPALKQFGYEK